MKTYLHTEIDRKDLKINQYVEILINDTELKKGKIKRIISKTKPKDGLIKVELTTGDIGRCVRIITTEEYELENFKFFNIFFYNKEFYSIYNIKTKQFFLLNRTYKNSVTAKHFLIFSSKEEADTILANSNISKEDHRVVRLNPNKKLSEIAKEIPTDLIIINLKRILTKQKLIELESKFKNCPNSK